MQTNLARPFTTVDLTSGYFTLSGTYRSLVLSDKIHSLGTTPSSVPVVFRLVAASPEANGFYGSKGLSSRIPAAYTFLEKEFWKQVVAKSLHEPLKPDGGSSIFDLTDPVSQGSLAQWNCGNGASMGGRTTRRAFGSLYRHTTIRLSSLVQHLLALLILGRVQKNLIWNALCL